LQHRIPQCFELDKCGIPGQDVVQTVLGCAPEPISPEVIATPI